MKTNRQAPPRNPQPAHQTIFTGDNLDILRGIDSQTIDLIYLDPPFNSNRHYEAPLGSQAAGAGFKDAWTFADTKAAWWGVIADTYPALYKVIEAAGAVGNEGDKAYLIYMAIRLLEIQRILKDTGSVYLHCDPTMSHSLKLVMDAIFGSKNFLNEIIWSYRTGGVSKRWFGRKHDTLLLYARQAGRHTFNLAKEKSYNRANKPYRFSNVKEYQDDEGKWYTMASVRDVWEINALGRTAKERVGYPTQKPKALLERIIKTSSHAGDMVLDPFCGCATTCIAAQTLQRQWVGMDISPLTAELIATRLKNELGLCAPITHRTDTPQRTDQIKSLSGRAEREMKKRAV